jgi:hypothetical protein
MKKLIIVLALVASVSTVALAVGKEKSGRKARRDAAKKEMKCCDKELAKECKKESRGYYEKKAEQ